MSLIVTTKHLYSVPTWTARTGFCGKGSRDWFAAHGLSWSDFVHNGIDAEILRATGDAMAIHLVEHAQQMEANSGR